MAYSHIHRTDLHGWLLGRIARTVRMGTSFTSLHEREDDVTVQFSDGTEGCFDLVVGADGVHSTVRGCCFQEHLESYTDWRAWYAWVDRSFARPRVVSQYVAPHECIAVFDEGDRALVVFIAKADHSIWDHPQHRVDRLKLLFQEEPALIPQCLSKPRPKTSVRPISSKSRCADGTGRCLRLSVSGRIDQNVECGSKRTFRRIRPLQSYP